MTGVGKMSNGRLFCIAFVIAMLASSLAEAAGVPTNFQGAVQYAVRFGCCLNVAAIAVAVFGDRNLKGAGA